MDGKSSQPLRPEGGVGGGRRPQSKSSAERLPQQQQQQQQQQLLEQQPSKAEQPTRRQQQNQQQTQSQSQPQLQSRQSSQTAQQPRQTQASQPSKQAPPKPDRDSAIGDSGRRGDGGRGKGGNRQRDSKAGPQPDSKDAKEVEGSSQAATKSDQAGGRQPRGRGGGDVRDARSAGGGSGARGKDKARQEEEAKNRAAAEQAAKEEEKRLQAKREEEEKVRREEEEKRLQEELARQKEKEAAAAKLDEDAKAWAGKMDMRARNQQAMKSREALPKTLDSSIKKTQTFIRKLKLIGEHEADALTKEFLQVNLSKYVSEVVVTMTEAKLARPSDISKLVTVSSLMHQRYADFAPQLMQSFLGVLKTEMKESMDPTKADANESQSAIKVRAVLRLLTELFLVGILEDPSVLLKILFQLIAREKQDSTFPSLTLLGSFLKYGGEEFVGTASRKSRAMAELCGQQPYQAKFGVLTTEHRESVKASFLEYFRIVNERYSAVHELCKRRERKNNRMKLTRGEVPESLLDEAKAHKAELEKLKEGLLVLSDLLDIDMASLSTAEDEDSEDEFQIFVETTGDSTIGQQPLYDDDETRSFYEDLPNLLLVVPPVLLEDGNKKEKTEERKKAKEMMDAEEKEKQDEAANVEMDRKRALLQALEAAGGKLSDKYKRLFDIDSTEHDSAANDFSVDGQDEEEEDRESMQPKPKGNHPLELLLANLPSAMNKASVDAIAEKFCYLNTKANRARIVQVLYSLKKSQQDSIPYYSRLAATLSQYFDDIGNELATMLVSEFYRLFKRRDLTKIDFKLRNIRYIMELTKFKVVPDLVIFRCWHACLLVFTPHNVQVVSMMLEHGGQWLYRNPATHIRCSKFLDRMMALKEAKFMDSFYSSMVDSAYFMCKPPTTSAVVVMKERSIVHQYIRKLVYVDLNPSTCNIVIRKLRKLKWDSECKLLVIKVFTNISNVKYANVSEVASVCAALHAYHSIGSLVVDAVLEEIRFGLETNHFTQKQRRTTYTRYLGELYIFQLCESQVIFDQLFVFITLGHTINAEGQLESEIDPPSDTFRIHLVCLLLSTCGEYFYYNTAKRRLDRFLLYFQQYIFAKDSIPLEVEYEVAEMFDLLGLTKSRCKSREEVEAKLSSTNSRDKMMTLPELHAIAARKQVSDLEIIGEKKEEAGDAEQNMEDEDEDDDEGDEDDNRDDDNEDEIDEGVEEEADEGDEEKDNNQAHEGDSELDEGDEGDEGDDGEEDANVEDMWGRKAAKTVEDSDFMDQFERMMAEDMDARQFAKREMNMTTADSYSDPGAQGPGTLRMEQVQEDGIISEHVVFKVLTRNTKSGKRATQVRELLIPADCEISTAVVEKELEEKREKADRKRLLIEGLQNLSADEELARRQSMQAWADRQSLQSFRSKGFAPQLSLNSLREFESPNTAFGRGGGGSRGGGPQGGRGGRGRGGRGGGGGQGGGQGRGMRQIGMPSGGMKMG